MGNLFHHVLGGLNNLGFQPVACRQDLQPFGDIEIHLRNREFLQHAFQDMIDVILFQLFTVHRHNGHAVFLPHILGQGRGLIGIRPYGV